MPHEIDIHELARKGFAISFWTRGNQPNQVVDNLTEAEVISHLKVSYLLSDYVIGAASYYFESGVTRAATEQLYGLFQRGDILYFIDREVDSFTDHGKAKHSKSSLGAYADSNVVSEIGSSLDSIGQIAWRNPTSISSRLRDLWFEDIFSRVTGSLGAHLRMMQLDKRKMEALESDLVSVAQSCGKDFVWEYIEPELRRKGHSARLLALARRRLTELYTAVTCELLGASSDAALSATELVGESTKRDTGVFLECLSALSLRELFDSLDVEAISDLKKSGEFLLFRKYYFSLIEASSWKSSDLGCALNLTKSQLREQGAGDVSKTDFIGSFRALAKAIGLPSLARGRSLEVMRRSFEIYGKTPTDLFVEIVVNMLRSRDSDSFGMRGLDEVANNWGAKPLDSRKKITLLFLAANPIDTTRLCLDEEVRLVREQVERAKWHEYLEIKEHWAVRVKELQGFIMRHQPSIVHFSGHGSKDTKIVLADESGNKQGVQGSALRDLFDALSGTTRCIVLNACYSEEQARSLSEVVDCVIGMSSGIDDKAAIAFSGAFYQAIAYDKDLNTAFKLACNQVSLEDLGPSDIPQLLVRDGVDAASLFLLRAQ